MASDAATTAAPTLPSDWRPTQDGCMKTDDLWIWDWGAGWDHTPTVLGGPAQTTECLPPRWDPYATFAASECPPDYTSASCSSSAANSAVTCCPTVYNFQCLDGPVSGADAKGNVAYQRCVSKFTTDKTNLITWANLELSTSSETRRVQHTYEHLFAGAIVYTTPTTTAGTTVTPTASSGSGSAVSSETSMGTVTSAASSSGGGGGGLSTGASVGIGVGVGVGALLLLAALFFLLRRRRRRTPPPPPPVEAPGTPMYQTHPSQTPYPDAASYQDPSKPAGGGGGGGYYYPASTPSPGLSTVPSSRSPPPPPHSPHAVVPGRHEMEDHPVPSELA